jgi:ABC-type antimicrobial peptide transport system permease subunit
MNRHFSIGFTAGLLLFLALNLLAAHLASDCGLPAVFGQDACADDITRAGWPLQFYEEGGFAYRSEFHPSALFINIATAVGVSSIAGWLYARHKRAGQ